MPEVKLAAAYIRVSTDEQEEYSPDSQLRLIRDYAQHNGFRIPDEYIFQDDGISAATVRKRPAFNRMIALAKETPAPFQTILVLMFSRFCRNREESVLYKGLLRKQGVQVLSIKEPAVDGPFGSLIESIIEWFDEYYLINLSSEVRRGMTEKFLRGEAMGAAPFGYLIDSAQKTFMIDETRAPIVRDIFSRYASGCGCREIAGWLNDQGITTRRGNPPDNRFVEYMLRNPVYIGQIRWTPERSLPPSRCHTGDGAQSVSGIHPPLISHSLWQDVQQRMNRQQAAFGKYQRPEATAAWMLKGLIRCSSCGATLTRSANRLQCHRYAKGICRISHSLSLQKAEDSVLTILTSLVGTIQFSISPRCQHYDHSVTSHAAQIAAQRRKLARCQAAYQAGIDTLEEYRANKLRLTDRIHRLESQTSPSSGQNLEPKSFTLSSFLLSNASADAKNRALRTIIDHIVYDKPCTRLVLYFRP